MKKVTMFAIMIFSLMCFPTLAIAKQTQWENVKVYEGYNFSPDMDFGAGTYAIASYDESRKMEVVSLLKSDGTVKTTVDISIGANNPSEPDISWNGSTFGVFWFDSWRIFYASVDPSGKIVTNPVMIYEGGVHVSAEWNKITQEYGVVFWGGNDGNPAGARFLRVGKDGKVLNQEVALNSVNGGGYYRPRIATDGKGFGVAWGDMRTCNGSCREVAFAYVNQYGQKVGDDVVLTSSGVEHMNDIVWNGSEFAILSFGNGGISLTKVNTGGELLDIIQLETSIHDHMRLTWNKDRYFITAYGYTIERDVDILLYEYNKDGLRTKSPTDLSDSTTIDYYPSNAVVIGNKIAVAWVGDLWGTNQGIVFAKCIWGIDLKKIDNLLI